MSEALSIESSSSTSSDSMPISLWTPEDGLTGLLVIRVMTKAELREETRRVLKAGGDPTAYFTFTSFDLFHKLLTPARIAILRSMMGQGPMSIRDLSRRLERDFKGVHNDVTAMFSNGLLWKTALRQIVFPFDELRFQFSLGPSSAAVVPDTV